MPDRGQDKPSLPVIEQISNNHSVPSISHWLMEVKRKLFYTTKNQIPEVEIVNHNMVHISFSKENVYLARAFETVSGKTELIPSITVLHLCSVRLLQAVLQASGKKKAPVRKLPTVLLDTFYQSPFTHVFHVTQDRAECEILSNDAVGKKKKKLPLS